MVGNHHLTAFTDAKRHSAASDTQEAVSAKVTVVDLSEMASPSLSLCGQC